MLNVGISVAAPLAQRSRRAAALLLAGVWAATLAGATSAADNGYRLLHEFTVAEGATPNGALVQASDGRLYGTAQGGGPRGGGVVFRVSLKGRLKVLRGFGSKHSDGGSSPVGGLTLASDGALYGTTALGGSHEKGTLFKILPDGQFTSLHAFAGAPSDGEQPTAGLVRASDGNFYGTAPFGGAEDLGTVHRVAPEGDFTVMHSFTQTEGCQPVSPLIEGRDGNFYGTAAWCGGSGQGTVFRMTSGGEVAVLHAFGSPPEDGAEPLSGLLEAADGNFYGTTYRGGLGFGTVFRLTPAGEFTVVHRFEGWPSDAAFPDGALIRASNGEIYGLTHYGGSHNCGTVYRLRAEGTPPKLLHEFDCFDGYQPRGALLQASNGLLYGTTSGGGTGGYGTVFRIKAN